MDSLFELIFGTLFDKLIFKIKQLKAQIIFSSFSKKNTWIIGITNKRTYNKIIINDENLLNLFLNKEFRDEELKDEENRKEYIENIKKAAKG